MPEGRVNRKMWAVLGVALILGSVSIGIWYMTSAHNKQKDTVTTQQSSSEKAATLNKAVSAANAKKDYAAAVKLLESQLSASESSAFDKATQTDTELKLATAYANQGNYKSALAIFDKFEQAGKLTSGYEAAAAQIAVQSQDSAAAIRYYQAAKARLKAENSPTVDSQIEVIDAKIADLEKQ